ncbi:MAG: ATP-dependent DNA ligase [Actinobacteria bacterium]|nr:ATP-dependent DNA ligase [Actinomycetota bacterium]
MAKDETTVTVDGQEVRVSHPDKVLFPAQGWTKMDVVEHFLGCAPGAVRAVYGRPCTLKRWPDGVEGDPFYLRRTKPSADVETVRVAFASAQPGPMWVPRGAADLVRMAQLGCIDLNPWPSRAEDPDHPDELRIDLDPTPGYDFDDARAVAAVVRDVLEEDGLTGWPKTSGNRGIHVYVRIDPRWTFEEVRRAALAIAREAERRHPAATTAWWKEERDGVFCDFNQMARDKTIASAYSVRQTGWVSTPFTWDELDDVRPEEFPLDRFPARWADVGDVHVAMEEFADHLGPTIERVLADEEAGLGDAPWPPHYPKMPGEPPRVSPSRARSES